VVPHYNGYGCSVLFLHKINNILSIEYIFSAAPGIVSGVFAGLKSLTITPFYFLKEFLVIVAFIY